MFRFKVGEYEGTGEGETQTIFLGFEPKAVFLMSDGFGGGTLFRTSDMTEGYSLDLNESSGFYTNYEISNFTSTGFDVSYYKNDSSTSYFYVAFGGDDTVTGTYVGDATDNRQITSLGFKPEWLIIDAISRQGVSKPISSGDTVDLSASFESAYFSTNQIQQLLSNGFEVGTNSNVNSSGVTYYYLAFKPNSNIKSGSYTGNGSNPRTITGVGFNPEGVFWISLDGNGGASIFKGAEPTSYASLFSYSDSILPKQATLTTDGFIVDLDVPSGNTGNYNGETYYYVAFKDGGAPLVDIADNISTTDFVGIQLSSFVSTLENITTTEQLSLYIPILHINVSDTVDCSEYDDIRKAYFITTWAELHAVRDDLNGAYYLMNDLSSSDTGYSTYASATANSNQGWLSIGEVSFTTPVPFNGIFDGQGHTVSDIYLKQIDDTRDEVSFFGQIGGTVKNLTIANATVELSYYAAEWTGVGILTAKSTGTIDNCHVSGSITRISDVFYYYIAGLVGFMEGGEVTRSSANVDIDIVNGGDPADFEIQGGLIGGVDGGLVQDCFATGSMVGIYTTGGFVGDAYGGVVIERCYANMEVDAKDRSIGGFVGHANATIRNCYATGSIIAATAINQLGGFVGNQNNGTIDKCYSTTVVTSTGTSLGGFSPSAVTTGITNSFWDTEVSGQATSGGATGKNSSTMKSIATYNDLLTVGLDEVWNITADYEKTSIWGITSEFNNGYPFLQSLAPDMVVVVSDEVSSSEFFASTGEISLSIYEVVDVTENSPLYITELYILTYEDVDIDENLILSNAFHIFLPPTEEEETLSII